MSLTKFLKKRIPDPNQLSLDTLFGDSDNTAHLVSTVPDTPIPAGHRRIRLEQLNLDYRLIRSKRKTIGFLIDDDGLRVSAPRWITINEIESAIVSKRLWIFRKMNEQRERSVRRLQPAMVWRDGAVFPYLGADITLRVADPGTISGAYFDSATRELHLSLPSAAGEQQLKDRVQGWLQSEAKRIFAERLTIYADKLGVSYQSFALSSASTQWGSCTADGKIRLNWRLMHFALPNIDYVVKHELSHLREMNHGPQFWATVQSLFPEFEQARKTLRDHEPALLPKF
ncbi:MAG: M48 family metallopeptidase [Burkholderiaceae bacterium]